MVIGAGEFVDEFVIDVLSVVFCAGSVVGV